MHVLPVSDLRKGRRCPVPDWAHNDGIQLALVNYLEARLYIKPDAADDLKTRLARCQAKTEIAAAPLRGHLKTWIRNYSAIAHGRYHEAEDRVYTRLFLATLRGEGHKKILKQCAQNASNFDAELYAQEKLAEIVCSVLVLYFRLGWNSPDIATHLGLKSPHVRQIIHRVKQRVRKMNVRRTGRPRKQVINQNC
jgi:DNA-directed RNA polymerase specialized sigma subunit